MTYKTSTGLRNHLQVTGSVRAALTNGSIRIFEASGEPPTADAAEIGTLLCVIDKDGLGAGFTMDTTPVDGILYKVPTDDLFGINIAEGDAVYWRHVAPGDTGALSTTEPRIQGRMSTSGAEGNISTLHLLVGARQDAQNYSINLTTF